MRMKPNIAANTANENKRELGGHPFIAVVADEAIVRVELPDPVTLAGANVQVVPAGSPEQANETAPLKAFSPFMKMDADPDPPDPPASTVID
jgi:hypothetical protein